MTIGTEQERQPPIVFVSYAHESVEHKTWVATLAGDLRSRGVDIRLDRWDTRLGSDVAEYMERSVSESDRVLLICTPTYRDRFANRQGGVGYENLVVTAELLSNSSTEKFVCVLRSGDKDSSIPAPLATRIFADFSIDQDYEESLTNLLTDLLDDLEHRRPPIGPVLVRDTPTDSELSSHAESTRPGTTLSPRNAREARKETNDALIEWRVSVGSIASNDEEAWGISLSLLDDVALGLLTPIMDAYESEGEGVRDHADVVDFLVNLPRWNRTGARREIDAPLAVAMMYHHLLGAYLIANRRQVESAELWLQTVNDWNSGHNNQHLFENYKLTGWNDTLWHNCGKAWNYISQMPNRKPQFLKYFDSMTAFEISLRAYQLLGSLCELTYCLRSNENLNRVTEESYRLDIPPEFVANPGRLDELARVANAAVPDVTTLKGITGLLGVDAELVLSHWPAWFKILTAWHSKAGRIFLNSHIEGAPSIAGRGGHFTVHG